MYRMEHKTPSYLENKKDYIESSLLPDFGFRCRESGYRFWLEAKFRRGFYSRDHSIEWCTPEQLQRYSDIDREKPLFLCLGLGSRPSKPKELFLIPIGKIHATALDKAFLEQHTFCPDKAALSSYLKVLLLKR
ncbi:hypothetical protein D770_12270 [Flammeovirgaceae bacterium 311]|nr:hypothetical protein D770_12270 [Flammeovirgaceae bacterium 311]